MFRFELDSNGDLTASPSSELKGRVSERLMEARAIIDGIQLDTARKNFAEKPHLVARHPAAQGLYAFKRGFLSKEHAAKLVAYLARMSPERVRRLGSPCLTVEQQQMLIPEQDTRGARILVEDGCDYPLDFLDQDFVQLVRRLGEDWQSSLQVNTVSFVKVAGMPELPHFSGSTSDLWGSMHMTRPNNRYVLAESVTHESSHFWVHCLEEIQELSDQTWDNEVWVSAWREDPRPIGGVIHGVHVFSCVAPVLTCLSIKDPPGGTQAGQQQLERLAYVIAQVEDGIGECERSGLLRGAGKEIVKFARHRLRVPQEFVGAPLLAAMRERVSAKRQAKQNNWRERGLIH